MIGYVTEPDLLAALWRLTSALAPVMESVPRERHDDPTPCGEWSVRTLLNHLADTLDSYATLAEGGEMSPGPVPAYDDPVTAFREQAGRALEVFGSAGYLDEVRDTPIGEQPGASVVQHVVNELVAHGWDLAKATGRDPGLVVPADIAERSLASWRAFFAAYPRDAMSGNFRGEKDTAEASGADRVAAYLGRDVAWDRPRHSP